MANKTRTVKLIDLAFDDNAPAQLRVKANDATVAEYCQLYRDAIEAGGPNPEAALGHIEAHRVGNDLILTAGHHRVLAAVSAGFTEMPCRVHYKSTMLDALVAAARSNATHGLPMTNADKRNAVEAILGVGYNGSTRDVAAIVGCSHMLVANIKQELADGESRIQSKRKAAKKAPVTPEAPEAAPPEAPTPETKPEPASVAPVADSDPVADPVAPAVSFGGGVPLTIDADDYAELIEHGHIRELAAKLANDLEALEVVDLHAALGRIIKAAK